MKNHSNELIPTCVTTGWRYSYIFRSVPAGTERKSRTGTQTSTRQPPIPPRVKFRGVSMCFGRFSKFWCVSAGTYISAELLFWVFFSFSTLLLLRPFFFFLFPAKLSLCNFSLLFVFCLFAKKKKKEWFLVQVPCPFSFFLLLVSCFFFFFFLSFFLPALSLSVYLFFTFFFFGSSAGLHVMLLDICLKFLLHLHFGVLCTLLFFFFLI